MFFGRSLVSFLVKCHSALLTKTQGNIATGEGGLHFLEEEEIIPVVIEIAESSPVLSLRGWVIHFLHFFLGKTNEDIERAFSFLD